MKEIILTQQEVSVLKDLQNNLSKNLILSNLKKFWLISWVQVDNDWGSRVLAKLTWDWEQLVRNLNQHKWLLDNVTITLDLGIVKISSK